MIEATLTLMLFLLIWFSLFDFGFTLFFHHTLMERARAAARYGILIDATTAENQTKIQNVLLFSDPDNTAGATTGILGLDASKVSVAVQPAALGEPAARLLVTVHDFQYALITPGFGGLHNGQDILASLPMEYP